MNHYTYNIINKTNGKYYIGMRSSEVNPVEDIGINYFGSSMNKELKEELNNDKSNFIYHIIETYDSRKDAYKGEERIHQKFNVSKDPMSYNIQNAGYNGFDRLGKKMSKETKQKMITTLKERYKNTTHHSKGRKLTEETKRKIGLAGRGRKHSEETKQKLSKLKKEYYKNNEHHQKGIKFSYKYMKTCPKCGISGKGNMKAFHFDNCTGVISGKQAHRHGLPGGEWYNRMSVEAKKRYMKKHKVGSKLRENFGV